MRRKHKVDCKVYRDQFSYDDKSDTIYYKYMPNGRVALLPIDENFLQFTRTDTMPSAVTRFESYYKGVSSSQAPPASVNRRSSQSPVDSQGERGTCTAFAAAAAIEALNGKNKISKNFLYLAIEGYNMSEFCKSDGDNAPNVASALRSTALPADAYWPYTSNTSPNNCPAAPPSGRVNHPAFRAKRVLGIKQNRNLSSPGTDANNPKFLEAVLAAGHNIIIFSGVAWFKNKIHDGEKPHGQLIDVLVDKEGAPLAINGGHAMLIVGYERTNDELIGGGYFWVKNSWGTNIGADGYMRITYDYARQYFIDAVVIEAMMTPAELQAAGGVTAGGGTTTTNGTGQIGSSGQQGRGTKCADENGQCKFNGRARVHYGANDKWVVREFNNGVACTNGVFGDPIKGVRKACYVEPIAAKGRGTKCADENGQCKFNGRARVHYGANDKWVVREFNNGVACTNAVFGDPLPGVRKACYFEPIAAAPTTKLVSLKSHHGRYVVAEADGAANANRTAVGPWEKWQLITNSDGTVSFKGHHGKYLVAEGDGRANANRGAIGPWEKWQLIRHRDGTVSLKSHHGKYLVAEGDGKLNANRTATGPWERFTLANH